MPEPAWSAAVPADCWRQIFGNDRAVAVEIGPGGGEFLLAAARRDPARNFYAIERSASRTRAIGEKLTRHGVRNAHVVCADAACLIELLTAASVAAFYVQFPDPWWKRRHQKRRLWSARFVAALRRALVVGGTVEMITDVGDYFAVAQRCLDADLGLEVVTVGHPTDPQTSFARKATTRGAVIYRSVHRRR